MEACGIIFFYLRAVFPLTLMLATASAQVCVPLGHSSLYFGDCCNKINCVKKTAEGKLYPDCLDSDSDLFYILLTTTVTANERLIKVDSRNYY